MVSSSCQIPDLNRRNMSPLWGKKTKNRPLCKTIPASLGPAGKMGAKLCSLLPPFRSERKEKFYRGILPQLTETLLSRALF